MISIFNYIKTTIKDKKQNQWYEPQSRTLETIYGNGASAQADVVLTLNPAEKAGLVRLTIFTTHAKSVIVKIESH